MGEGRESEKSSKQKAKTINIEGDAAGCLLEQASLNTLKAPGTWQQWCAASWLVDPGRCRCLGHEQKWLVAVAALWHARVKAGGVPSPTAHHCGKRALEAPALLRSAAFFEPRKRNV